MTTKFSHVACQILPSFFVKVHLAFVLLTRDIFLKVSDVLKRQLIRKIGVDDNSINA